MRVLSNLLFVLAAMLVGLAIFIYIYMHGMACSHSTGGGCRVPAPWRLNAEDFQILILIPGAAVTLLVIVAALVRPKRRSGSIPRRRSD